MADKPAHDSAEMEEAENEREAVDDYAGRELLDEALTRLSTNPSLEQQFRSTMLRFMHDQEPVTTTQSSLAHILTASPPLQEKFSPFLQAPITTESERTAARAQLAKLINTPLMKGNPAAPSEADTLAFSDGIKERLGSETHDSFMHIFLMRLRNQEQGIATRPQLVKLLESDEVLLRQFEAHWPAERGDL